MYFVLRIFDGGEIGPLVGPFDSLSDGVLFIIAKLDTEGVHLSDDENDCLCNSGCYNYDSGGFITVILAEAP